MYIKYIELKIFFFIFINIKYNIYYKEDGSYKGKSA